MSRYILRYFDADLVTGEEFIQAPNGLEAIRIGSSKLPARGHAELWAADRRLAVYRPAGGLTSGHSAASQELMLLDSG